jgi:translocation and assembly module TamA
MAAAADPQPYRVEMASVGNEKSDATLAATSELLSLRRSAPVSPFGLIARARSDQSRLKSALESFGYYQSRVVVTIDGTALDDPRLGDRLGALPKGTPARVAVGFDLGPLYHVRHIAIEGTLSAADRSAFSLAEGDPAVAAALIDAGARLQTRLQEQGFAFAQVDAPVGYEDATDPVLDVSFHVTTGPRAVIGEIRFVGLRRMHEKFLRARLLVHSGEKYSPAAIERARKDLSTLGVFAAITVQVGAAVDATGGVPITFDCRERARHAVTFSSAYSSDLGGNVTTSWTDRDVFGGAQQLTVSGSVIDIGGSATTGLGYNTSIKYLTPDFGVRDQSLQLAVGAIQQSLQAYDQTAVTSGATLTRKLSNHWNASAGVSASDERIVQEGMTHDYTLIGLPLSVSYDSTDLASPLDDPRRGMRDSLSVTPTRSIGHPDATFIISQLKLADYIDLHPLIDTDPGRSVLALRALAGLAQGAGEFSLPPDQRFYGGGSGTIRGYRYQAVGPQFPITPQFPISTPIGGTAIIAGSVEFRQRIGANWGAAVFVDGGQVSSTLQPLPDVFRIGIGAGIRYYTPIGPIRLDVAVPTKRYSTDDDSFELYIGLGQAF